MGLMVGIDIATDKKRINMYWVFWIELENFSGPPTTTPNKMLPAGSCCKLFYGVLTGNGLPLETRH